MKKKCLSVLLFIIVFNSYAQVTVDLTSYYDVEPNQNITLIMSVSGLDPGVNPLGIQGTLNFDSGLIEYLSFNALQSMVGLQVSEVTGYPDKITFLWATDFGNSTVTNGDLIAFNFKFIGSYNQQANLFWNNSPLGLMMIDDLFNPIDEMVWNDAEVISMNCDFVEIVQNIEDIDFCFDEQYNISLSIEVTGTEPINYQWQFYNVDDWENVTDNNPSGTTYTGVNDSELIISGYTNEGDYQYKCLVSNCNGEESIESNISIITIKSLPELICPADTIVTTNEVVGLNLAEPKGGEYSGTGVMNNEFNPEGLENGSYIITYTYSDPETNCINECSFNIYIDIDVNIENYNLKSLALIYPNPSKGTFVIDFSNLKGVSQYKIFDAMGSIIKNGNNQNDIIKEIQLNLDKGIYFVKIVNKQKTIFEKIVVN